jgi:hypothetical protein
VILKLQRKFFRPEYIIGYLLTDDNLFVCNTLENAAKSIPEGAYEIFLTLSPKLDRITPELDGVPERNDIRIHAGNTVKDTQGCILVGINDKAGWLSDARKYEDKLVAMISQCQENAIDIFSVCPCQPQLK